MTEFLRLLPPDEARSLFLSNIAAPLNDSELVDTSQAMRRVNAEDVIATHALPEFARSTVDGYALRARDTFGASASLPAYLRMVGEVGMGSAPGFVVASGQCALIHTGGMLPAGADAVAMLENTQGSLPHGDSATRPQEVEILKPVAPGENMISIGEDVKAGQRVIPRGVRLRAQELGGLMALGMTSVQVTRRPRVALISSGDEIVDPRTKPLPGQVRDVNASTLSGLISDCGGDSVFLGVVRDEAGRAEAVAKQALPACDMVVITAGSSASTRDLTAAAIASLGTPGVLVHGVNIRPGKPTILGVCEGKAVIGLPGNPVSALVVARLFVVPAIERLLGLPENGPRAAIMARLTVNLASQTGREDWWPVRLQEAASRPREWLADPVFGRSNLIFSLVAAHGLIRIPAEKNGLSAGELVEVEPF
ncbi:MAG: gephyrin-like molybdotransferase Glp [Chloroflexota bacterium]